MNLALLKWLLKVSDTLICMRDQIPLPDVILEICDSDCDLFSVDLAITDAIYNSFCEILSASECDRMMRFVKSDHQRDFVAARGTLRSCLAQYVDCDPKSLVFAYGSHGKPMLQDYPELQFNLSHSQGRALIGIARGRAVGVDLEEVREVPTMLAIAKRFFMPSEYEAIERVSGGLRSRVFFEYWTCKEAYIKATGVGLGQLGRLEIAIDEAAVRVLQKPCDKNIALAQVELGDGFVGAIGLEV